MPLTSYTGVPIYRHNVTPLHPLSFLRIFYAFKRYECFTPDHQYITVPQILRNHLHSDHHPWFDDYILTLPHPLNFLTVVHMFHLHFSPSCNYPQEPLTYITE